METINIDLIPGKVAPMCFASQYDVGREIKFYLFEGGKPFSLDGTETVSFEERKPDGHIVTTDLPITSGTSIILTTTEQMTACKGSALCEFTIKKGDVVIGTMNFFLFVEQCPTEGGLPSASDIENLNRQVQDAVDEYIGDDYYTKAQVDTALEGKADASAVYDKSETYDKSEIDTALSGKANVADIYTKSETYSATEIDTALASKADASSLDLVDKKSQFNDYDFSLKDLFDKYESSFIDDFLARASFSDEDHAYTVIGNATNPPAITTGVGAVRTGAGSSQGGVFYSRNIDRFPYVVLIGNPKLGVGENAQKLIKLFDNTAGASTSVLAVSPLGVVSYGGVNYGNLHQNALYYVLYVDGNTVSIFDDTGIGLVIPVPYTSGKPKNIALGFATNSGRIFGYGAFIEFIKRDMAPINLERAISANAIGEPAAAVKSIIAFTHTHGNAESDFYYTPQDNPYMGVVQSGISNNLCVKCIADYDDDTGYRTEVKIAPVASNLKNKLGGLQRVKFSADYYVDSNENIDNDDYYTYIFQIHDNNFVKSGWGDPPPLSIKFKGGKLFASVTYISDGSIPASDPDNPNDHVLDDYELAPFEMDKWHKLEVEARIGWKNNMSPRLIVKVDGIERLNIQTPFGFNIVSSGGIVGTHCGVYCPQFKTGTFANKYREVLVTNINWQGSQNMN